MMSTSLSSQQDSRPGRLSPTKGEGGTAASSMPFVSFLEMRTSQEPVLSCNLSTRRGSSRLGFPIREPCRMQYLGDELHEILLAAAKSASLPPLRTDSPRASHQGIGRGSPVGTWRSGI